MERGPADIAARALDGSGLSSQSRKRSAPETQSCVSRGSDEQARLTPLGRQRSSMSDFSRLSCLVALALLAACVSPRAPMPSAARELERLNKTLLASDSATLTLEAWCSQRGLADPPIIVAKIEANEDRPASAEQRVRLKLAIDEPIRYRRVELVCGEAVLSVAENWYVPRRLTSEMNAALETTQTPFGKVIRPLDPRRINLGVTRSDWLAAEFSGKAAADLPDCTDTAFSHAALVTRADGLPLAEVLENYPVALACN